MPVGQLRWLAAGVAVVMWRHGIAMSWVHRRSTRTSEVPTAEGRAGDSVLCRPALVDRSRLPMFQWLQWMAHLTPHVLVGGVRRKVVQLLLFRMCGDA